ncbi:hypothetical protein J6590_064165 [Homalodisca vitripennis]|nr:hypothetical protein J6590_064165 [Homalodisca vitripennis]
MAIDVQGARNKVERICQLLQDAQPDIVILSEHGLKTELLENTTFLRYSLKAGKPQERRGCHIYIKQHNYQITHVLPISWLKFHSITILPLELETRQEFQHLHENWTLSTTYFVHNLQRQHYFQLKHNDNNIRHGQESWRGQHKKSGTTSEMEESLGVDSLGDDRECECKCLCAAKIF